MEHPKRGMGDTNQHALFHQYCIDTFQHSEFPSLSYVYNKYKKLFQSKKEDNKKKKVLTDKENEIINIINKTKIKINETKKKITDMLEEYEKIKPNPNKFYDKKKIRDLLFDSEIKINNEALSEIVKKNMFDHKTNTTDTWDNYKNWLHDRHIITHSHQIVSKVPTNDYERLRKRVWYIQRALEKVQEALEKEKEKIENN